MRLPEEYEENIRDNTYGICSVTDIFLCGVCLPIGLATEPLHNLGMIVVLVPLCKASYLMLLLLSTVVLGAGLVQLL